ncbi:hypothetical protein D3C71_1942430 [compost metagenome]
MRFARIGEFKLRTFHLAIRATDKKHVLSPLVRDSSSSRFIDQATGGEAFQREWRVDPVWFVAGNCMRKDMR